jgi:hypothetical protein
MRMRLVAGAALALAMFGAGVAQAANVDLITNGGFENPNIGPTNYTYPGGALDSWNYNGSALVNAQADSAWYPGGTPPSGFGGDQFAALQGTSTLSQVFDVSSNEATGPITLSWLNAGRSNTGCCNGAQNYEVLVDNSPVGGLFSTTDGENFTGESLALTGLGAGNHTLTFEGLAQTDETAFLDNVAISAVPEPATWAMILFGVLGLGGMVRQSRRNRLAELQI